MKYHDGGVILCWFLIKQTLKCVPAQMVPLPAEGPLYKLATCIDGTLFSE